jgi:hypothetical protein
VAFVLAGLQMTPRLTLLDISGSTLTSQSHACGVMTWIKGGAGNSCDGGCDCSSFYGRDRMQRCDKCDCDLCSTCVASACPMIQLGEAVSSYLPELRTLRLSDLNFEGVLFADHYFATNNLK